MESLPPNQTHRTGENCFTCSLLKGSTLPPSLRKWCSGPPRTRIPKTRRLSVKFRRTRSNFWPPCGNAGPERPCLLLNQLAAEPSPQAPLRVPVCILLLSRRAPKPLLASILIRVRAAFVSSFHRDLAGAPRDRIYLGIEEAGVSR